MKVCSRCGTPDTNTGVCYKCGSTTFVEVGAPQQAPQPIPQPVPQPTPQPMQQRQPQAVPQQQYNPYPAQQPYQQGGVVVDTAPAPKKKKTAIIIVSVVSVVVVAIIAAVACILAFSNSSTPEATAQKFVAAFEDLDVDAMADCFAPEVRDSIKQEFSDEGFDEILSYASMIEMKAEITGEAVYQGEDRCTIPITMSMSFMGETENENLDLILEKIDGEWYISSDTDLL